MTDTRDEIEIQVWWNPGGGMMYRCDALDPDHFMHPYNQIKAMGKRPEDYGIEDPFAQMRFEDRGQKYMEMSKRELVMEIFKLQRDIESIERHYA